MKNLIVAAFAAMLTTCALQPAFAADTAAKCDKVPDTAGANVTVDTYKNGDAAKLAEFEKNMTRGLISQADEFRVILDKASGKGMVYVLWQGCVVAAHPASAEAVRKVLEAAGVQAGQGV